MTIILLLQEFPHVKRFHTTASFLFNSTDREGLLQQLYNDEDTQQILDFFNNKTGEELFKRRFGTERLRRLIIEHRPFKSLPDVSFTHFLLNEIAKI